MVKAGMSEEQAKKRAITAKLSEKYQNECTSHISSSLDLIATQNSKAKELLD